VYEYKEIRLRHFIPVMVLEPEEFPLNLSLPRALTAILIICLINRFPLMKSDIRQSSGHARGHALCNRA
jgi:hypothetical protein